MNTLLTVCDMLVYLLSLIKSIFYLQYCKQRLVLSLRNNLVEEKVAAAVAAVVAAAAAHPV